ncbi:ABC transporter ATP-binding protein [Aminobacter sp. SR38]|jgi:branched-chain amino acid transport system ATP-binding protein|uniref:ABC transporter ATP-binding protein n=1 Tax=Aminobacter sp. SR38 TaxID=2774562 RepID=UPI001AEE77C8|nr:ABC transporter ATP-binding protein [Aminobacter sp. SR38]
MSASSLPPILKLDGIVKRFGGLTAVNDVSMRVSAGEVVGILGPNGSGKTTLFSTVSGFLRPNAGTIEFDGKPIQGMQPHEICNLGLARTFQIVQPFMGLRVLDNVVVGCLASGRSLPQARERAAEIVDFVGMGSRSETMAAELSLPDRKRLELAKALSTEPKLILLDEIMAGLRPSEVTVAVDLIKRISALGVTILIVEHLMQAILALCERIYVLQHGSLIASGEPRACMQESAVVDAYFGEAYRA